MAQYQTNDGWNYIVFDGFQGGLQTTIEPNKIPDNASPEMYNIVFEGGNSFQPRYGISAFGETSSNYGGITSMFNFKHSNGTEYMMRTFDKGIEYYNATTSAWSHILSADTANKTFGFATYSPDDEVYFGNGTDFGLRWNGTSARQTSSVTRGNLYLVHESRLIVGGLSSFPNTIYYSKPGDPLDFTGTISASAGQGGVQKFGAEGNKITGLRHFGDKILIGKPDTLWTFEYVLDYGTESETPIAKPLVTSEGVGPTNNSSFITIDNYMSWVTKDKKIKNLSEASIQDRLSIDNLSDSITPTMDTLSFTAASSVYFDRKLFIACRNTSSAYNDVVLVYDFKYKAWTRINGWSVGAWAIWLGNLYYGDSLITKTYRALTGRNDASSNIQTLWRSKEIDFGFPQITKTSYELYIEGYITSNTTVNVKLYKNSNTDDSVYTSTIVGTEAAVDQQSSVAFGERIFGDQPYGGPASSVPSIGYKFRKKFELPQDDYHSVQVEISSDGDGQIYRITHIGFFIKLEDERVFKVAAFN